MDYVTEAVLKDYGRGHTHTARERITLQCHPDLEKLLKEQGIIGPMPRDPMLFRLKNQSIWFERTTHLWYHTATEPNSENMKLDMNITGCPFG